ncbi:MAG: hypothetical protein GY847_23545 [Proteobacteria bacterium]|nr:hypothetical protein [Pseudomonadota bacterium]
MAQESLLSDQELIEKVLHSPESAEGKRASEELEYRKYVELRRHNNRLLLLTFVLSVAAVLQTIVSLMGD